MLDNIPEELRVRLQWVVWKDGKIPYTPGTQDKASSTDPSTWRSFGEAEHALGNGGGFKGVGYVFSPDDPYVGIDLDDCVNGSGFSLAARQIVDRLSSYTEYSPSGKGVHIIVKGSLPLGGRKNGRAKVEMYDQGRYFTVTGDRVEETPASVNDNQAVLDQLHKETFGNEATRKPLTRKPTPAVCSDINLTLKRALANEKFRVLYSGEWASLGFPSQSEAVGSFCFILAGYTREAGQIDQLFRSSGLFTGEWASGKWDRLGDCEANRALANVPPIAPDIRKAIHDEEVGDATLLATTCKDRFCFDRSEKQWYLFNGNVWQLDECFDAANSPNELIRLYGDEFERVTAHVREMTEGGESPSKSLTKYPNDLLKRIGQLKKTVRRKKVVDQAATGSTSLAVGGKVWDQTPGLLATPDVVIDLESGSEFYGQPEQYIRTASPTKWRGINEPCPQWESFLLQVFDGDMELIKFVQRLLGYSISGIVTEHILPVLWGQGRNGKGTLIEALKHVLGPVASKMEAEMLLDSGRLKSASAASPEIVFFRGKRICWASETGRGNWFSSARVKELTGGDTLAGRGVWEKNYTEFTPTHTLFLLTNHKPQADSSDYAFWQRVLLIPFRLSFVDNPREEFERPRDSRLSERLKQEASGILAWLVRGYHEFLELGGLNAPPSVMSATDDYRDEVDDVTRFVSECCTTGEGLHVMLKPLFTVYKEWCGSEGFKPRGRNKFSAKLDELGYIGEEKNQGKRHNGLELCE